MPDFYQAANEDFRQQICYLLALIKNPEIAKKDNIVITKEDLNWVKQAL